MRELLEQLPVEPRPDEFFENLWDELQVRETRRAIRWRRIAIAAAAVAIAAVSTGVVAAVSKANVVEQTVSCSVPSHAGLPLFQITAAQSTPGSPDPSKLVPGMVRVTAPESATYLSFDSAHSGLLVDRTRCHRTEAIPLTHVGLVSSGTFTSKDYRGGLSMSCHLAGPLVIHFRVTQRSDGTPTHAQMIVRAGKRSRPIAYVDWSAQKEVAYSTTSSSCTTY